MEILSRACSTSSLCSCERRARPFHSIPFHPIHPIHPSIHHLSIRPSLPCRCLHLRRASPGFLSWLCRPSSHFLPLTSSHPASRTNPIRHIPPSSSPLPPASLFSCGAPSKAKAKPGLAQTFFLFFFGQSDTLSRHPGICCQANMIRYLPKHPKSESITLPQLIVTHRRLLSIRIL